jgi:cellulose 1,4-beta-cellobiosidase
MWHGLTMGDNIEELSTPSEPYGLIAVPGDAEVTLTWKDTMADGGSPTIGHHIYWSTEPGENLIVVTTSSTNYTHQGLFDGSTYYCQVRAFNANGGSDRSTIVNVTLPTASAPSTLPSFLDTIEGQVTIAGLAIFGAGGRLIRAVAMEASIR